MSTIKENQDAIQHIYIQSCTIVGGILIPAKKALLKGNPDFCNQLLASSLPVLEDTISKDALISEVMFKKPNNPHCIGLFALAYMSLLSWPKDQFCPFQVGQDDQANRWFLYGLNVRIASFEVLIETIIRETADHFSLPKVTVVAPSENEVPDGFTQFEIQPPSDN